MKEVIFPAINLKLNINPVAIHIFGISIYWYAVIIVLAFAAGILVLKARDGLYRNKF